MGKAGTAKGKGKGKEAKDGGAWVKRVDLYKWLGKWSLRSYPDSIGRPLFQNAAAALSSPDAVRAMLDADCSETIRRPAMGVNLAAASIDAANLFVPALEANLPKWKEVLEEWAEPVKYMNLSRDMERTKEENISKAEAFLKKARAQARGKLKEIAAVCEASASIYLASMAVLEVSSVASDLEWWASKVPEEKKQSKQIRKWIKDPNDKQKLYQALAAAVKADAKDQSRRRNFGQFEDAKADSSSEDSSEEEEDAASSSSSDSDDKKGKRKKNKGGHKHKKRACKAKKAKRKAKREASTSSSGEHSEEKKARKDSKRKQAEASSETDSPQKKKDNYAKKKQPKAGTEVKERKEEPRRSGSSSPKKDKKTSKGKKADAKKAQRKRKQEAASSAPSSHKEEKKKRKETPLSSEENSSKTGAKGTKTKEVPREDRKEVARDASISASSSCKMMTDRKRKTAVAKQGTKTDQGKTKREQAKEDKKEPKKKASSCSSASCKMEKRRKKAEQDSKKEEANKKVGPAKKSLAVDEERAAAFTSWPQADWQELLDNLDKALGSITLPTGRSSKEGLVALAQSIPTAVIAHYPEAAEAVGNIAGEDSVWIPNEQASSALHQLLAIVQEAEAFHAAQSEPATAAGSGVAKTKDAKGEEDEGK